MSFSRRAQWPVLAAVALSLCAFACNKTPAADAIKASEEALAVAPEIAAYLPDESAAVATILRDARVSFGEGRYTDALRAALPLPDRIAAARIMAERRKREKVAEWDALAGSLPARLDAIVARLGLLVSGGWISSERQIGAQARIVALHQAWAEATATFERGEIGAALALATQTQLEADSLAGALGMRPASTGKAETAGK